MIKNTPNKTSERGELLREAIEHRATWFALLIEEARKQGLDTTFAMMQSKMRYFHGKNKYPRTMI